MEFPARASRSAVALALGGTAAALLIAQASIRTASAQSRASVRLEYARAAGAERCPDEEDFRGAVRARIGRDPFEPAAGPVLRVEIARRDGGLTASVRVESSSGQLLGTRLLRSRGGDCHEIIQSTTLAVSMALDLLPRDALSAATPSVDSGVALGSIPDAAPTEPDDPDNADRGNDLRHDSAVADHTTDANDDRLDIGHDVVRRVDPARRPAVSMAFGVEGSAGLGPTAAAGPFIGLGIRWPRLSMWIEGRIEPPIVATFPPHGSIESWQIQLAWVTCLHVGPFGGCGLFVVSNVRGVGRAVDQPHDDSVLAAHAGLRALLEWSVVTRVRLRVHVDGLVPLRRAIFRLDGVDVWTAPWIAGSLGLSVSIEW